MRRKLLRALAKATRETLPPARAAETFEFEFEGTRFVATFSRYADGRLAELFLHARKSDCLFDHLASDTAKLVSFALQHGARFDDLSRAMTRDANGHAQGLAGHVLDLIGDGR